VKRRVALLLALTLLGVVAVTAGCGGSGQPSCSVYDQHSAAYITFSGGASRQKLQTLCGQTARAFSRIFHHRWGEQQNPSIDYSHAVRVCEQTWQPFARIDMYDSRSGSAGHTICKVIRHNPLR
jgi:hypothetical protein